MSEETYWHKRSRRQYIALHDALGCPLWEAQMDTYPPYMELTRMVRHLVETHPNAKEVIDAIR